MPKELRAQFFTRLATPLISERLFAQVPDIVFCIKDTEGKYISANPAFANRRGLTSNLDILGKTAHQIFPAHLADNYTQQDQIVFNGSEINDQLELIYNSDGSIGWYLATKIPLYDEHDKIIGLASISRDLKTPSTSTLKYENLAKVVNYIQENLSNEINMKQLAAAIELTQTQLDRKMRKVFYLSTAQFIRKTRLNAAIHQLLTSDQSISTIALNCGYSDQSAFTRIFKTSTGLTPKSFRSTR